MKSKQPKTRKRNLLRLLYFKLVLILFPLFSLSQADSTVTLTFDFNEHEIKEVDNKVMPKPVGAFLTYDRFGNERSAVQTVGANQSYLNLGTSTLFKSPNMSISLWVKMNDRVYTGKGDDYNPILIIKNKEGFDYINAIALSYDCLSGYLGVNSTKDSLEEVIVNDDYPLVFNKWYHLVIVCNNNYLALYKDGKLTGRSRKYFETEFMASDSLVIGHSANTKNNRYSRCVVDDIKIFHRSLSPKEVNDLYNAPNPNEFGNMWKEALKYLLIILALILVIVILIIRNKRVLKKQKEELELARKISDLELKAVKAQMNPHFISNCMAAIQNLIYTVNLEKATLYIAKFSFFLRQVLNYSDEDHITLSEEVEMINLFVELEQLRFENGFKFDLYIDGAIPLEDTLVPSLITQPFIENAIWHGLLPLKNIREPELTVHILLQNGFPLIEIMDNGIGRDLTKKLNKRNKGTRLVMDKIDILNRISKTSNYKIEIIDLRDENNKRSGTKILIHLDAIKE